MSPHVGTTGCSTSSPYPCHESRGFAKGWFPKWWFRRMFPRNENRNEGTFAKTTLLETALLSPSDPFLVLTKGWFPKGWFRRMFPRNENRNEGTFAKTTLLETALLSPSEKGAQQKDTPLRQDYRSHTPTACNLWFRAP